MTKVLIVGHLSEFDSFVTELQRHSILHLTDLSHQATPDFSQASIPGLDKSNTHYLSGLEEMSRFLDEYREKESLFQKLLSPPRVLKREDYNSMTRAINPETLISRYRSLRAGLDLLEDEEQKLISENDSLTLWKDVTIPLNETGNHESWSLVLGSVEEKHAALLKSHGSLDCEVLYRIKELLIVLVAYHRENQGEAEELLQKTGFLPCPLQIMHDSPAW